MEANTMMREKLHHYIDIAEENKLQAIYTLLENEIDWHYSSELIDMLSERRDNHLQGKSKSYTLAESVNLIRNQKK